jgi:phospholipid N-methyltransferase
MAHPLKKRNPENGPVRVLEIGPGTGAVTGTIVKHIQTGDTFDLVELNEVFAATLDQRFETDPKWNRIRANTTVHVKPLQEFPIDQPYDYIISGLPLNNFPADLVTEIADCYFKLLAPGGVLSYFEYMYIRSIRKRIAKKSERGRLRSIDDTLGGYVKEHRFKRNWVFVNIPPAWVEHLKAPSQPSQ